MAPREMLLLGLLGLVLLVLGLLDSIIRLFTEWLFATSIISWILSVLPNFMFNIVVAAVQAALLNWSLTSILWYIIHVKVQRTTLSHDPNPSSSKLELSFDTISYMHQDIASNIRSMKITLDINPNVSPWIMISIIDPYVMKFITKGTHDRNKLSTKNPETPVPNYLEWLFNTKNGGLLQLLLRHVKFCVENGIARVVDRTHEAFSVNLYCKEFGLREYRSIHEDVMYTNEYKQLYMRMFSTKITVGSDASATFYCNYFSLHMASVAGVRSKPYESKTMNILLGRQYWIFDVWIQLVCFYLGTHAMNENVRKRGEVFFARQIDIKLANIRKEAQDTGKLQIKVELPICIEYRPELANFVVCMYRCIAHYRPADASNRANREMVPIPTTCQTFPAALDMVIHATFGKVTCLLWNEHDSCLLVNWKNLTMKKMDDDTEIRLHTIGLQLGDYSEFTNAEKGNEKLTVDEIIIKHGDDSAYYQDLFIYLKNSTVTWNKDVHNHFKQMIEEMNKLATKLNPLMPPSRAGKRVTICINFFGTVRVFIPLTNRGPTVEMVAREIKVSNAGKYYIVVQDAVINVGWITSIKHVFLCIESEDKETRGGWIMTTHKKDPFELNKTTLYKVVFKGFVPIYEWLKEWW